MRPLLGAGVVFLLLLLGTAGLKGYRDLTRARQRERQLESRIEETRRRVDELTHLIEALREDPVTLERLAREELGMVFPGDILIVLPEEEPRP